MDFSFFTYFTLEKANHPSFHPGKSAELFVKGESVAIFGEIHPQVEEVLSLNEKVYLAELDFEKILNFRWKKQVLKNFLDFLELVGILLFRLPWN